MPVGHRRKTPHAGGVVADACGCLVAAAVPASSAEARQHPTTVMRDARKLCEARKQFPMPEHSARGGYVHGMQAMNRFGSHALHDLHATQYRDAGPLIPRHHKRGSRDNYRNFQRTKKKMIGCPGFTRCTTGRSHTDGQRKQIQSHGRHADVPFVHPTACCLCGARDRACRPWAGCVVAGV